MPPSPCSQYNGEEGHHGGVVDTAGLVYNFMNLPNIQPSAQAETGFLHRLVSER
jgi:hypothetical protein